MSETKQAEPTSLIDKLNAALHQVLNEKEALQAELSGIGQFGAIQSVAPSLGVELTAVNVRDPGEVERAIWLAALHSIKSGVRTDLAVRPGYGFGKTAPAYPYSGSDALAALRMVRSSAVNMHIVAFSASVSRR